MNVQRVSDLSGAYAVRRPDSWGCCVLCHFTTYMLMATGKAACFILKLNDFTDIS